jgi:hypothetical protein
MLDMVADRPRYQPRPLGDLTVCQSLSDALGDRVLIPTAEMREVIPWSDLASSTRSGLVRFDPRIARASAEQRSVNLRIKDRLRRHARTWSGRPVGVAFHWSAA